MDLQSVFYIVGIIFMVMMIALLLTLAYFLTKLQTSIQSMRENIATKTQELKSKADGEIASMAGGLITSFIMSRIKNAFKKKRD